MTDIKRNLEVLLAAVKAQPEELFDLGNYKQYAPCGTLFCTAGLAASIPFFQEQGMELVSHGSGGNFSVHVDNTHISYAPKTNTLFGNDAFEELFQPNGLGFSDSTISDDEGMPDKELAIARLEKQLTIYS